VRDSLLTDEHLNVIRTDQTIDHDVWVIGDAARVQNMPLPATAQGTPKKFTFHLTLMQICLLVANQQGKYIAKKLNKIVKDQEHTQPFQFNNKGSLAYIGNWCVLGYPLSPTRLIYSGIRKAIYDRSNAEKGLKTKESGRLAWLLWRSAYFTMTLSVRNK